MRFILRIRKKTMKIRIDVTSENREVTQSYNLTLLKKVDVESVSLSETEHTMDLSEGTFQLTATVLPEDASYALSQSVFIR